VPSRNYAREKLRLVTFGMKLGPEVSGFWNAGNTNQVLTLPISAKCHMTVFSLNFVTNAQWRLTAELILIMQRFKVPRLSSEFDEATVYSALCESVRKLGYDTR
jgi:hypothetical protein